MAIEDHSAIVKSIVWPDEAATRSFAQSLAASLLQCQPAGHAIIELHGDLGAGKTTLVRHLLGALGVTGRIKSPTYAVVEPYSVALTPPHASAARLAIWHFDFYRFNDPDEWEEAGFRDLFASTGLKLVEWPEKAGDHLPAPDLAIHITLADALANADGQTEAAAEAVRQVQLRAFTPTGRALIDPLA